MTNTIKERQESLDNGFCTEISKLERLKELLEAMIEIDIEDIEAHDALWAEYEEVKASQSNEFLMV